MRFLWKLLVVVLMTSLPSYLLAQIVVPTNPPGHTQPGPFNPIISLQFGVCCLVVVFGLIVLFGQFWLLRKVPTLTSDDVVKNVTISVVIFGALVLIIVGYDSQQTAQAFGLFGTIVGYLLGRSAGKGDASGDNRA